MQPLALVKFMFELGGFLSGYKTYITAAAGALAVVVQFLAGPVMNLANGELTSIQFLTDALPTFVQAVSPFIGLGTLRAGIK